MNKDIPFTIYRPDGNGNVKKTVVVAPKKHQKKKENRAPNWKNNLLAGAIVAGTLIGGYFLTNKPSELSNEKHKTEISSNTDYIASAKYQGQIYNFTANDPSMIKLSKQKNYFNLENLTLNKDSLDMTLKIANQLTLSEIMETANLNGMHKLYTGYSNGNLNFNSALNKLWLAKVAKMEGRFPDLALKFSSEYNSNHSEKTTLPEYKSKIKKELDTILDEFDYESFYKKHNNPNKKSGHPEKQRFFENYFAHLNENILTAYGITELFPSETNPVLNAVFLDKMLREAGEEFVNKIPALFDPYLSFGFFQLTSKIITPDGAPALNTYLPKKLKIPASMKYYDTPEEHIRGAALVNIYNAEILANTLFAANQITNFNNNFEKLTPEEQEVFIAGYGSAAHHAPIQAANAVCEYQKKVDSGKKSFDKIITDLPLEGGVKKYYTQSLKNYLVLKELDKQNN